MEYCSHHAIICRYSIVMDIKYGNTFQHRLVLRVPKVYVEWHRESYCAYLWVITEGEGCSVARFCIHAQERNYGSITLSALYN